MSTRLLAHEPFDRAIARIAEAGIRAVEVAADRCHLDPRLAPDVARAERALREHSVDAVSLHLPYLGLELGHPSRGDARRADGSLASAIASAARLGAPTVVLHPCSFFDAIAPDERDAARDAVRRLVERTVGHAERAGVTVALEGLVSYGVWRVGTSLRELAALFPEPRVGFCLDSGHVVIEGLDVADEVTAAGERLALVHLDDNDGIDDRHLLPGEGVLDRDALFAALGASVARPTIVHEVAVRPDASAVLAEIARRRTPRWTTLAVRR